MNTKTNEIYNLDPITNANDLRTHIINVDSRYRNTYFEPATNFHFDLPIPLRNIIKVRVSSVEIPNVWYEFTNAKKNTSFSITAPDISGINRTLLVTIPEGNYSTSTLLNEIQLSLNNYKDSLGIYFLISVDPLTIKCSITFQGTSAPGAGAVSDPPSGPFSVDFRQIGFENARDSWGLGYLLGFRRKQYTVTGLTLGGLYILTSESLIDPITDSYIFLIVNEFYAVAQKTEENFFEALAKIVVRQDKAQIIYDDGSTLISNEVTLPSPIDLKNILVQLVDGNGDVINLNDMNFSFTLEVTEVMNLKLHEYYRTYIWNGQDPKISPYARGSAVAGYLPLSK